MADDRAALLAEAYKRDILPPDMKSAYEEAQKRGIVGAEAQPQGSSHVPPFITNTLSKYLPSAISDIPREIHDAGAAGIHQMFPSSPKPEDQTGAPWWVKGSTQKPRPIGPGVAGVAELATAPVTGAARSAIGHPLSTVAQVPYEEGKHQVDLAMLGIGPRGGLKGTPHTATPATPKAGPAPALDDIFASSNAHYEKLKELNVPLRSEVVADLGASIKNELEADASCVSRAPELHEAAHDSLSLLRLTAACE